MRPDEHKKRKNAQYKKKHGIAGKQDADKKDKSGANKKAPKTEEMTRNTETTKKSRTDNSKSQAPEDIDSDSEQQVFRRRNLVSNWSRYDDLPSEEDDDLLPSHRGEDFNKLLASAGGSSAQFRFHDEEDWESTGVSPATTASVLTMNLEDLHQGLSCIPLHHRLGIPECLFSESQLKEMDEVAATRDALRIETLSPRTAGTSATDKALALDDRKTDPERAITIKSEHDHSKNEHTKKLLDQNASYAAQQVDKMNKTNAITKDLCKLNSEPVSSVADHTNFNNTGVSLSDTKTVLRDKMKTLPAIKDDTAGLEDDLDMLLSLDKPKNKPVINEAKLKEKPVKTVEINKKESKQDKKITELPKKNTEKENLEDWLDSMLDD